MYKQDEVFARFEDKSVENIHMFYLQRVSGSYRYIIMYRRRLKLKEYKNGKNCEMFLKVYTYMIL